MIIHNLDVPGAGLRPPEAQAISVVDPNAVLAEPIALERFEPIAWGNAEIFEVSGDLELTELSPRHRFNRRQSPHPPTVREQGCFG